MSQDNSRITGKFVVSTNPMRKAHTEAIARCDAFSWRWIRGDDGKFDDAQCTPPMLSRYTPPTLSHGSRSGATAPGCVLNTQLPLTRRRNTGTRIRVLYNNEPPNHLKTLMHITLF